MNSKEFVGTESTRNIAPQDQAREWAGKAATNPIAVDFDCTSNSNTLGGRYCLDSSNHLG